MPSTLPKLLRPPAWLWVSLAPFLAACGPSGNGQVPDYVPPAATPCTDGALTEGESDIDCGGACSPCLEGQNCRVDADCGTDYCTAGNICGSASCDNSEQDPGESGVDCGGTCPQCLGGLCSSDPDCRSGYCDAGSCATASCVDGKTNGAETGVDCGGGECPLCAVGQACLEASNCISGYCDAGYCAEPACNDDAQNGNETDVDCGGACQGCVIGKACETAADCLDGVCPSGVCADAPETCADNEKNGTESDTDCGGASCPPCASSKFCGAPADCLSETCIFGVCKDPSCSDGTLNQAESDIDCGGPCTPCEGGKLCGAADDCESGRCPNKTCATCDDGVKDADELGVDCGGACNPCGDGTPCDANVICGSDLCVAGVCVACDNGIKDGNETDTDCGGPDCAGCSSGAICSGNNDCDAGSICDGGQCCVANACGACGVAPTETCNGVDDDCDGATDEASEIGPAPACSMQLGVCSGAVASCELADGWTCSTALLQSHNAKYQAVEASCDGLDNDCDGQTDEGVTNACGGCGAPPSEVCDGLDNDCDGSIDEGVTNACGTCGAVPSEVCDGLDNDCDGQADEGLNCAVPGCGALIISEYAEGASNNKAIELTNVSGSFVPFSSVGIWLLTNPTADSLEQDGAVYPLTDLAPLQVNPGIGPGETVVLCHANYLGPFGICDYTAPNGSMGFNGNDAVGITIGGVLVDKVGSFDGTGGSDGWSVGGTFNGTKDHRLVRQPLVVNGEVDWVVSQGQWQVLDISSTDTLGEHAYICP